MVDSAGDISNSVNFTLRTLGRPPRSGNEIKDFIGDGAKVLLERALGVRDEKEISEALEIFKPYYLEHCADQSTLYPGVRETLEAFEAIPMGVISNKPQEMIEKILERFAVSKYFKVVLGPESTREKKPHPEPVLKFLAQAGVPAKDAAVVGDGITDIQAGKSAGTLTCAVTYGYKERRQLEAQKPDFVIDHLSDLVKIFRP